MPARGKAALEAAGACSDRPRRPARSSRFLVGVLVSAHLLVACGGGGPVPADEPTAGEGALTGRVTVAAASSLTGVLEELGADFGDTHPGVRIELTFGASSANAAQVLEGAPVDVVASADAASMDRLVEEDLVSGDVVVLARNRLVVITPPDDPAAIRSLADLEELPGGAHVSLCGRSVPCGRYAAIVLDRAGIDIPEDRVSRGQSAAATTSAVTEGDAVAGIVYATDAAAAGDSVRVVTIPPGLGPLVTYPVAVLEQGGAPDAARAFVEHLTSDEAWPAFERHGFLPPG